MRVQVPQRQGSVERLLPNRKGSIDDLSPGRLTASPEGNQEVEEHAVVAKLIARVRDIFKVEESTTLEELE